MQMLLDRAAGQSMFKKFKLMRVCALQVHVYSKHTDVYVWSEETASVLIISYDMFSRLKAQATDAMLRGTGGTPTEKVCCAPPSPPPHYPPPPPLLAHRPLCLPTFIGIGE